MLTVCVHSQPTLGHFVNGHYAIVPIQCPPEIGRIQSAEGCRLSPCLFWYLRQQNQRAPQKRPFAPTETQGEGSAAKSQNMDGKQPREEEREETCCLSHYTDSQQGQKSQPWRKRAPNAFKRAKRCSKLFWFFFSYKKAFYLFPWCECRARLKHLLMHWGLETTVVHRACLIHYTHNNYSEALEFEQPVTEHWALPQIKKKKYLHMMTFARSFRTPPPKSASATVQWVIRDPMGVH